MNAEGQWQHYAASFAVDAQDPLFARAPWSGHRAFAYDLIRNLAPARIVELGVHIGCSYFAFCQAVSDAGFSTELCAVDTWQGDEHAGFYDDTIFQRFSEIAQTTFHSLRLRLLRKTFRSALADIAYDSVDVLHFDGLHTYEALKDDFDTWLPKLAPDGVMLFHDIAVEQYTSQQLWRELAARHPSLQFEHSWGLGVLFPKGVRVFEWLRAAEVPRLFSFYQAMGELGTKLSQAEAEKQWQREQTDSWWRKAQEAEAESGRLRQASQWQRQQTDLWWQKAQDAIWRLNLAQGLTAGGSEPAAVPHDVTKDG